MRLLILKAVLLGLLLLLSAGQAWAQAPIFVGPTSTLQWDMPGTTSGAVVQPLSYAVTVDSTPPPVPLQSVVCADGTPAFCKAPLSNIPLGNHSITMTAASGTLVSAPSVPFAYLTLVVPVPSNIKLKQTDARLFSRVARLFFG